VRNPLVHALQHIMVFALCFFFFRAAQDSAREEQREREALLTSP
jgi:hypothetical protein